MYHIPVMLNECMDGLNIKPGRNICRCDFRRRRTFNKNSGTIK
jgi:16S rRNA C1402 N4-methylase RsmH